MVKKNHDVKKDFCAHQIAAIMKKADKTTLTYVSPCASCIQSYKEDISYHILSFFIQSVFGNDR